MIPSIDTYIYSEIEEKLQLILSNRYIIEEILKGVQPKIAENFMRSYYGPKGREVPIVYTMPQEKVTQQGAIYIGLREGRESDPSIGNIEGTYDFKEGQLSKQIAEVQPEESLERMFLEVDTPIGELINVEGLAFSRSDNVKLEGPRIYFKYDESLLGLRFPVNYLATTGDEHGLKKGFTATESYSVLAISTNMDTVRCLDLIIKSIMILMRANPEENNNLLLQRIQFGQIQEVDTGRSVSDGIPEILYGRETIVTYTTSYTLDAPILGSIEKILLNINYDNK